MSVLTLTPQHTARLSLTTTRSGRRSRTPARYIDTHQLNSEDEHEQGQEEDDEEEARARGRSASVSRTRSASVAPPANAAATGDDEERPFHCEHPGCNKSFKKRNKLNRHILSHTDERKYICQHPGCDKKFLRSQHLAAHQQTHSGPSSAGAHDQDIGKEAQKQFVCIHPIPTTSSSSDAAEPAPVCGKRFWTKQKLNRHMQSTHETLPAGEELTLSALEDEEAEGSDSHSASKKAIKLYHCDNASCNKVFRKRKHLRAHIWDVHSDAPHLSPYTTPTRRSSSRLSSVQLGTTHEEEDSIQSRPFPCNWPGCTMRFPTNSHRRIHEQRHEEKKDKSYTCALPHPPSSDTAETGAGMLTFSTWSLLRAHMRQAHPPRCPRPECIVDLESGLGRSFKSTDGLKAHLKRHEERDALLEAEEEAEVAEGDEEDDEEEEEGEEEEDETSTPFYGDPTKTGYRFACSHVNPASPQQQPCPKRFKTARALDVHTRVVHLGERRFQCSRGCGRRFGYKCTKERHEAAGKCVSQQGQEEEEEEEMDDDYFREEGGAVPERDSERVSSSTRGSRVVGVPVIPPEVSLLVPLVKQGTAAEGKKKTSAHTGRARGLQAYGVGSTSRTGQSSSSGQGRSLYELFTGEGYAPSTAASTSNASEVTGKKRKRTPAGEEVEVEDDGDDGQEDAAVDVGSSSSPSKKRKMRARIYACPWRRIVELQRRAQAEGVLDDDAEESDHDDDEEVDDDDDGPLPECEFRFSRMYDLRRHVRSRHGVDLAKFDKAALEVIMA
ncbi:hypothetical protein CF319_g6559 [Tilletia indica]|nr:hypothetical protein CF319_g6559 [Tilletia indica]